MGKVGENARRAADLHGDLDVSMLLLRYAGMADLYTGAVQRRVRTIPGSAAGRSAGRSTAASGTALSVDLPSPGLPRGPSNLRHAALSRRLMLAAIRPIAARAGLGTSRWRPCDGRYRSHARGRASAPHRRYALSPWSAV